VRRCFAQEAALDIASVLGLVVGCAILLYTACAGGAPGFFVDYPAMALILGGSTAALFLSFPMKAVLGAGKVVKQVFFNRAPNFTKVIADMVSYAEVARRDGILSLENMTKDIKDEFVVKGIQMAVDGLDPEVIEQILHSEVECMSERHSRAKAMTDAFVTYGPAYGMIGTLFGLADMFRNIDDPKKIGPGMAVALLATLYGCIIANVFAGPISNKLSRLNDEEELAKQIVIRGIMSIQSGDNPRIVEQKLKSFLPPKLRAAMAPAQ
jgi:chemotaxis protein MotA